MIPLIISVNHHQASVALREQLAFSERTLPAALTALAAQSAALSEVAILSTCNRVALIVATDQPDTAYHTICEFLASWHQCPRPSFEAHLARYEGREAVQHLMRVTSGLDSLVPGETQILGQVRAAADSATETGTAGPLLQRLFTSALRTGRQARQATSIARRPVSVSHAAVALAREHFGSLEGRSFLLVGSGKMGAVAAAQLHDAGATHFIVANRTLERACELAQRWNGTPVSLDDVPGRLAQIDAVIACTAAPHIVLTVPHITEALALRPSERPPLLLIDLAVPRDIDPDVSTLPGVLLYDVDGLQAVVARNLTLREGEREAVEAIIAADADSFLQAEQTRQVGPLIADLRRSAESIRQAEMEKARRRLGTLSPRDLEIIEMMSQSIVNKLLHTPTVRLKAHAASENGALYHHALRDLFALDVTDTPHPHDPTNSHPHGH